MSPRRLTGSRAFGLAILALSVFSVGLGVKASVDRDRDVQCLTGYIAENARVAKVRAAATLKRDAAVDALLTGVTSIQGEKDPKRSQAKLAKAFTDYRRDAVAVARERAANPLPDLPATCDDLER